jgi:hypothetical protein
MNDNKMVIDKNRYWVGVAISNGTAAERTEPVASDGWIGEYGAVQ